MNKRLNKLSSDELYVLIGKNVARLRKKANLSQLALSLEMGNKSTSLLSSAEVYKNKRKFNIVYYPKMSRQLFLNSYSLKYLLLYATFPFTKLQF